MIFLKAFSVFLGTIIGAGIFGLPFVAMKAGFLITVVYFFIMGGIVFWIHLLYAEVALDTKKNYRLPGYVEKYLGPKWKNFSFIVVATGLFGALLAYLIIGGEFLSSFLSFYLGDFQNGTIFYTLLFFGLGAYLIFKDIKRISQIEFALFIAFFIILGLLVFKLTPFIEINNLKSFDFNFFGLPYGAILFSLWGTAIIPEIKEMLAFSDKNNLGERLKKTLFVGTLLIVFFYLLFIFIVLGVCGNKTSEEAIFGLKPFFGNFILKLILLFGIISCFTSFIALGLTLKKIFWYDFGFSKNISWFLACFLPLTLFFLGLREFIKVIGFTGAVSMGLEGIIIVMLYRSYLKQKICQRINPFLYVLVVIFMLGIALEAIYFLF